MIRRRTASTRLTRTTERQNKKQTVYFTIGTLVLIIALIQFGPIIINLFGNVIYSIRGNTDTQAQLTGNALIQPPVIYNIPDATQSEHIPLKGRSPEKDGIVEIYVNDDLEKEIEIGKNVDFEIEEIPLKLGQNIIKTRFIKKDSSSAFSANYIISYIKEKPSLELIFPTDGSTFTRADKSITVRGKTEPENIITINSFRAIIDPDGDFSYQVQLNDGDNQINIEVKNLAGVTEQKSIKVTYNP